MSLCVQMNSDCAELSVDMNKLNQEPVFENPLYEFLFVYLQGQAVASAGVSRLQSLG